MIAAVVSFTPMPLIIWAGTRDTSPFLFVAIWYAAGLPLQALLRQMQPATRERRRRLAIASDLAAAKRRYLWASGIGRLGWLLYVLAVTLAGPVIATVVLEFWPAIFAMFTLSDFWQDKVLGSKQSGALEHSSDEEQKSDDAKKDVSSMMLLLLVGSGGAVFAVLSGSIPAGWSGGAVLGLALAAVAALAASLAIASEQAMGTDQRKGSGTEERFVSASGGLAAQAFAAPFVALAGVIAAEVWSAEWWTTSSVLLAVAAAAAQVSGNWCLVQANHESRRSRVGDGPQINSLIYLTPIGALSMLAVFADIAIDRPDLLIIGAAGVVVVNMILHLDPEGAQQRANRVGGHGYRALMLALWGAGAAVLLRDDWLPDDWQLWSVVEYWGMIGVLATVFTLILSFRQSRRAERRREMDALVLTLHHQITALGEDGDLPDDITKKAAEHLRYLDTATEPKTLNDAYLGLRKLLTEATDSTLGRDRTDRLRGVRVDVDVFANLRQQGRNFAEVAVLTMFAGLVVALAVAARPAESTPFAAWVHDTSSLVIAAAFAFLGFDLLDKRREADAPLHRKVSDNDQQERSQPAGWRLELDVWTSQRFERRFAAVFGAALLIGAVIMLGIKWVA